MASHLTLEEREIIARMHWDGKMQTQIADRLCRDKSTISRELRRSTGGRFWQTLARNDTSPCNARACDVGATRFELATF